ncbi:11224_t:CDS:2, partial [Funneliformis geosporum]
KQKQCHGCEDLKTRLIDTQAMLLDAHKQIIDLLTKNKWSDIDLRAYLQSKISDTLFRIHKEHAGNILYFSNTDAWYIDFGDQQIDNLPYITPEIIVEKEYTFTI